MNRVLRHTEVAGIERALVGSRLHQSILHRATVLLRSVSIVYLSLREVQGSTLCTISHALLSTKVDQLAVLLTQKHATTKFSREHRRCMLKRFA